MLKKLGKFSFREVDRGRPRETDARAVRASLDTKKEKMRKKEILYAA
ncbi:hypothetical protein THTE_2331 [Thermogutta terrifontis]|uniref:Uncharacterized protein n=1 Tax=Thermogutta terrifontis TaxID=1331910 RepID=A0A286RG48_9BACT|nr:hypothetical protein THTE_2331 [Thermogutta terrifontis]